MYGMNKKIGNVSYYDKQQSEYTFTKPYSETTAQTIDEEVRKLIEDAFERTKKLLTGKRRELELVAKELLKKEVLFESDLVRLIGKRPFNKDTEDNKEEKTKSTNKTTSKESKPQAENTTKKIANRTAGKKNENGMETKEKAKLTNNE